MKLKTCLTGVFCIILLTTWVVAQTANPAPNAQSNALPKVPQTVDEAVLILKTKWLSAKDLSWILRNPQKDVVARLYRPFGTGVRNEFGLWGNNQALRDSCGANDPEECSVVIFNRLWESVRADADPSIVQQVDCQIHLAEQIQISEKGFYKLTIGQVLDEMQRQINEQLTKLAATGAPPCQNSLTLDVISKLDRHCYVDAAKPMKNSSGEPKNMPLQTALQSLGLFNLFSASHEPPKIALDFMRECQFLKPPYLY